MRGIAQTQPINEYKQEAFGLFENMLDTLREDVTKILATAKLQTQMPEPQALPDLPDFLTGHIDPVFQQIEQPARPNHVVGII